MFAEKKWLKRYKLHFTDEGYISKELHSLLDRTDISDELRSELLRAEEELNEQGAVTYPTQARIDYYLHQWLAK